MKSMINSDTDAFLLGERGGGSVPSRRSCTASRTPRSNARASAAVWNVSPNFFSPVFQWWNVGITLWYTKSFLIVQFRTDWRQRRGNRPGQTGSHRSGQDDSCVKPGQELRRTRSGVRSIQVQRWAGLEFRNICFWVTVRVLFNLLNISKTPSGLKRWNQTRVPKEINLFEPRCGRPHFAPTRSGVSVFVAGQRTDWPDAACECAEVTVSSLLDSCKSFG